MATEILCAATTCRNNHDGHCEKEEITLNFVTGSDNDLYCTDYEQIEENADNRIQLDNNQQDGDETDGKA